MKHSFNQTIKNGLALLAFALLIGSCKYENIAEAVYPESLVYLPAAVTGVYNIDKVVTVGATRYAVDASTKKFNIPLGAAQSGITTSGNFTVNLATNADTINKIISANLLTGTELLPTANYTLPATATAESGKEVALFNLAVDLDFLRNNATKKFAVGVSITSSDKASVSAGLKTAIIVIDAKILKPIANFTSKVTAKSVAFTNTSTYATKYVWNFGDGTATETTDAPTHVYATAGTYTVTLTTTGITGSLDANTKTLTVTVL